MIHIKIYLKHLKNINNKYQHQLNKILSNKFKKLLKLIILISSKLILMLFNQEVAFINSNKNNNILLQSWITYNILKNNNISVKLHNKIYSKYINKLKKQ